MHGIDVDCGPYSIKIGDFGLALRLSPPPKEDNIKKAKRGTKEYYPPVRILSFEKYIYQHGSRNWQTRP